MQTFFYYAVSRFKSEANQLKFMIYRCGLIIKIIIVIILFLLIQIPVDSSEGLRFRSSYSYVQSASHIAILDPFTGEQKMMWTHLNDPKIVYDVCKCFIIFIRNSLSNS